MVDLQEYADAAAIAALIRQADDKLLESGRRIMLRLLEDHPGDFPMAYEWLRAVNDKLGISDPDTASLK